MIKKFLSYVEGLNGLIVALYIAILFTLRVLTLESYNIWVVLLIVVAVFLLTLWSIPKVFDRIRRPCILAEISEYPVGQKKLWIALFFGINFIFFFVRYLSVYPGGFVIDSINQYTQVVRNNYNDWHPALHTFLFFTVPYKLTGQIGSIVFMQIVYLSSALTYMEYVLMKYAGKGFAVGSMLFILLNPSIQSLAVIPTKDIAFSIASVMVMSYTMHIFFSGGKWVKKTRNLILFVVFAVLATIFRHNAVLFILPLCVGVAFYMEKKQIIAFVAMFMALFFLIKIPMYSLLGVQSAEKRSVEMAGMPMTIIANVIKEHPEKMDDELKDFAYSIAEQESWNDYQCGNFNSIKWAKNGKKFNLEVLDDVGIVNICRLAVKSIVLEPNASLRAMAVLFNRVVAVEGDVDWHPYTETAENEVGVEKYTGGFLDDCFLSYGAVVRTTVLKYLFYFTGILNLIILAVVMARMKFTKDWRKMLLCIPLLLYNWGTMLLLTGIDFRFFIVSFFVFPAVVLIMFKETSVQGLHS